MFNQSPLLNQYFDPDSCLHPALSTSYRIPIKTTPITPAAAATATPLLSMAYNSSPLNYYQHQQQQQQPPLLSEPSPNLVVVTPTSPSTWAAQRSPNPVAVQQKPSSSTTSPAATTAPKRSHAAATLNSRSPTDSTVGTTTATSSVAAADTQDTAEQLPAELRKLFEPLFCRLCKVQSNSPTSAKMHYDSKVHHKRVTQWLSDWALRTGEPVPKRPAFFEGPTGPDALHCRHCDLALTSLLHAQQHYMGRRHKSVMHGNSKPSGTGFYDTAGKWTRTGSAQTKAGGQTRDFGEAFVNASVAKRSDGADGGASTPTPSLDEDGDVMMVIDELEKELTTAAATAKSAAASVKGVICSVCNISVSAQSEMQKHLEGKQHAKKLRAAGAGVGAAGPTTQPTPPIAGTVSAECPPLAAADHSANRTPSGQYYCKPCNLTLASEHLFGQHVGSKKHTRAAAAAGKNGGA